MTATPDVRPHRYPRVWKHQDAGEWAYVEQAYPSSRLIAMNADGTPYRKGVVWWHSSDADTDITQEHWIETFDHHAPEPASPDVGKKVDEPPFKPGDRVRNKTTGSTGTVQACDKRVDWGVTKWICEMPCDVLWYADRCELLPPEPVSLPAPAPAAEFDSAVKALAALIVKDGPPFFALRMAELAEFQFRPLFATLTADLTAQKAECERMNRESASTKDAMTALKYLGDNPHLEIRNVNDEYFESRVADRATTQPWHKGASPQASIIAAMAAWDERLADDLKRGLSFVAGHAERKKECIAIDPSCFDCDRPYGDDFGFPDLVIPHDVWKTISPDGEGNGVLCPSCICKRLAEKGLTCEGKFTSGPIADGIDDLRAQLAATQARERRLREALSEVEVFRSLDQPELVVIASEGVWRPGKRAIEDWKAKRDAALADAASEQPKVTWGIDGPIADARSVQKKIADLEAERERYRLALEGLNRRLQRIIDDGEGAVK